jgi:hypothetical protein
MAQRNLHEGESGYVLLAVFLEGRKMQVRVWRMDGAGLVMDDRSGGATYTSQGESPLVDLVRQVLNS